MRIILIIILIFSIQYVSSQITVTNSNKVAIGDTISVFQTTVAVPTPGNSGTNQTWDFSNFNSPLTDPIIYIDPALTPYVSQFPNANLASVIQGTYNYEEDAGQTWLFHGLQGTSFTPGDYYFEYTPAHFNAKFPMNYLDSYTHNYVKKYFLKGNTSTYDSLISTYVTQVISNFDGWGTLITPLGTYNSLREYRQETDVITTILYKNGNILSNSTSTIFVNGYYWWSENVSKKFPIAIHNTSGTTTNGSSSFTYYDITPTSPTNVNNKESRRIKANIYPNPSSGIFSIEWGHESFNLTLNDIQGRQIILLKEAKTGMVDFPNLNPGIYWLALEKMGKTIVKKILISK